MRQHTFIPSHRHELIFREVDGEHAGVHEDNEREPTTPEITVRASTAWCAVTTRAC